MNLRKFRASFYVYVLASYCSIIIARQHTNVETFCLLPSSNQLKAFMIIIVFIAYLLLCYNYNYYRMESYSEDWLFQ